MSACAGLGSARKLCHDWQIRRYHLTRSGLTGTTACAGVSRGTLRGGARADTPFPGLVRSSSPPGRQRRKVTSANCASRKRGGLDATSSAGAAVPQTCAFRSWPPAGSGRWWQPVALGLAAQRRGCRRTAIRPAWRRGGCGGRVRHGFSLWLASKDLCGHHGTARHRPGPLAINRFCPVHA